MSKYETLLINQTEKQLLILNDQSRFYHEWLRLEQKLIDTIVANESFLLNKYPETWESARFLLSNTSAEIKSRWNPFNGLCGDTGLHLSNRIIRHKSLLSLKSLAVEVKLSLKLSFNSEIWIITRGTGVKDPNAAIIKISKESDPEGIYIVFGSPIGPSNEFVFFKRQQIPEENFDPNEELTKIEVLIKDNGDDRIYVTLQLCSVNGSEFKTYCSKFIPSLIDNRVMIAGVGRSVILENVFIQQKGRTSSSNIVIDPSKHHQCCLII